MYHAVLATRKNTNVVVDEAVKMFGYGGSPVSGVAPKLILQKHDKFLVCYSSLISTLRSRSVIPSTYSGPARGAAEANTH